MWDKWRPDLVVGLFLLAHLALSWQSFPALWGLDLLSYAPWGYALVFALGAVALWLPWPAALTAADPWRRDGWGRLARLALATAGLAFFVLWHTRTHLLGDGYLMLRELGMLVDRTGNEPLALWVLAKLYRAELGLGAEAVYRTASYAAGVCYIGLSFAVAAALSAERKGRWIALGILLSAGYLQLFCGYVENYPPLFAGTLLYLWGGVLLMRGQLPLWVLSGGLALLMTYHFIAAMLGPSLLVATRLGWRRGHGVGWGRLVGGLALGPVVVLAILYGIGLDLFAYATGLRGGHLLPVWAVPDTTQAYGLLDLRHGLDLLSVQLLVGAAPVLVVLACKGAWRRGWSDERLFFAAAGGCALLFTALANPEIGAFRDWDILAFPALPLGLWAACVLVERQAWRAGRLICGACALHALVWVGINADAEAGTARFARLLDEGYLSRHARAHGLETLGVYYRETGQREQALASFARAAEVDPHNRRYGLLAAREALALQRPETAVRILTAAVAVAEEDPQLWDLLGTAYAAAGRYGDSVAAHRRAVARQGRDAVQWYNLGNALLLSGQPAEALSAYGEAATWGGSFAELSYNTGLAHEALGAWAAAIKSYGDALRTDAAYAPAQSRLAQLQSRIKAGP